MMNDDDCGLVGGIIGKETEVLRGLMPQYYYFHHKSQMT
jgi:hypothetical protein